jgi:hypothetical protein
MRMALDVSSVVNENLLAKAVSRLVKIDSLRQAPLESVLRRVLGSLEDFPRSVAKRSERLVVCRVGSSSLLT